MAPKKSTEEVSLFDPSIPQARPRLNKLSIENFRCITKRIEIELDDIVVLVGANNAGKSTILKAYEIVMSTAKIGMEDFPNRDMTLKPIIELETIVSKDVVKEHPAKKWMKNHSDKEYIIKERWIWESEGIGKRQGFNVETNQWDEHVPWGAPNVANARRPLPHRVDAFSSPEKQSEEITKILISLLEDKIKEFKDKSKEEETDYSKLLEQVKRLRKGIVEDTKEQINKIELELQNSISRVFPGYVVEFDAKPEDNIEESIKWFENDSSILMGPAEGFKSDISNQGSGARRTLLWSALKIISENAKDKKKKDGEEVAKRPHVLLLDEPEICLHPNAIRDARDVLYDLPNTGNWQVMITTHSPVFIDITRDHTTIVRVERNNNEVESTTIYRPDRSELTEDEKEHLKLLNIFDPYVAEFFFGGHTIIVEGDTEYSVFRYLVDNNREKYKDIHVIRARSKASIVALVKILNQFKKGYSVLNDSDNPELENGNKNPAWTMNENIAIEVSKHHVEIEVKLCASITNFEIALFEEEVKKDKPFNAIFKIKNDEKFHKQAEKLLDFLLSKESEDIERWVIYSSSDDLLKFVTSKE
jgi:putative ATP-dependent endonuclease of the OLD family